MGEEYPGPATLSKLVAAGVPLVFSSDSHAPAEVAWGREEVVAAARAAGATSHVTFRNRAATRHPL